MEKMLPTFVNTRPKSASDLFMRKESELRAREDSSEMNRYRTYNVKDLKMAKAYLPQDVLREFKKGFEASTKSPSVSKSQNFVKRFVAALESKKDQRNGHCVADDEFLTNCYISPSKNSKNTGVYLKYFKILVSVKMKIQNQEFFIHFYSRIRSFFMKRVY